ncbi:hypothetical protein QVD17_02125 [Tagetes erecta]|uniref:Reverse transcriptase zinc-binding domain-containing protein n=1 Tax=Tagetes erecta TaxID=13708 RepID=A0AAD8LC17_TARER|nr:hypothetical protein QVD17_02125 [Tagetes erecta]
MDQLIKGNVGKGSSVRFWIDSWASDRPFKVLFPDIFALETCKSIFVCDCFSLQGSYASWAWRWKRDLSTNDEIQQLQTCQSIISNIHITNAEDSWTWTKDSGGKFTVSSMRNLLRGSNRDNNLAFQWNSWVPLKVNIFAWRAEKDRIATRLALSYRGIPLDSTRCPHCGDYDESANHLLVSCYIAHLVWQHISSWCKIPPLFAFTTKDILEAHKHINVSSKKKKIIQAIILTACWSLWKTRNERIFEDKEVILSNLLQDIRSLGFIWIKNRSSLKSVMWKDWCSFGL